MLNSFYFNFPIYLNGFQCSAAFAAGYWEILRKRRKISTKCVQVCLLGTVPIFNLVKKYFYHFMPIHLQANTWKALK